MKVKLEKLRVVVKLLNIFVVIFNRLEVLDFVGLIGFIDCFIEFLILFILLINDFCVFSGIK